MGTRRDFHKVIIGRAERLDFIVPAILSVPAKVDTGAYRSAIHAKNIVEKNNRLHFELLKDHPVCGSLSTKFAVDSFSKVWIANSFGEREERYEVKLQVKLGLRIFSAQFTLADRSKKIYPVLMGRKLLNGRFMVDTDITRIDRVKLKSNLGIEFPLDEEEGRNET